MSGDNKKFFKLLIKLELPMMVQEIINSSVNLLDQIMVGQLGLESINAVGLSNKLFFLFILLVFGTTSGSSIFMGQFWGKGDVKSIHKTMGICFSGTLLSALIFGTIAIVFPEKFMGLLSENSEVIRLGVQYLRIIGVSYFLSAIIATFNASLRSIGKTTIPMLTTFVALISNFVLNYVFIFIFKWGVAGAALATLIARIVELCVLLLIVFRFKLPVASKLKGYFSADKAFILEFLKVASPVILNEFFWSIGTFLYDVAYKYCGDASQGALQISGSVQGLFMVFGFSIGTSCGIMLANLLGAGERETAIRYSKKCLFSAVSLTIFMGVLLIVMSSFILSFYKVDPAVQHLAKNLLVVVAIGLPVKTYNYTTICGVLRSGGDTKFCLILDVLCVWLVGVPMAFLGSVFFHFPIYIVLLMVYSEEIVKLIFSSRRVLSNKWAETLV